MAQRPALFATKFGEAVLCPTSATARLSARHKGRSAHVENLHANAAGLDAWHDAVPCGGFPRCEECGGARRLATQFQWTKCATTRTQASIAHTSMQIKFAATCACLCHTSQCAWSSKQGTPMGLAVLRTASLLSRQVSSLPPHSCRKTTTGLNPSVHHFPVAPELQSNLIADRCHRAAPANVWADSYCG